MFPSDLEPAQIARKLVATMEARTQSVESSMIAPSRYAVYVNPVDYGRLAAHREYLEKEWAALLTDVAGRVGIRFQAAPRVDLRERPQVVAGAIDVEIESEGSQSAAAVEFTLRVVKGMPAGGTYRVRGEMSVGRNVECDIFLVDPSVSRNHALLDVRDGSLVVLDAGSSNGTFVNGERVQFRALGTGDVVAFGKTEMRVE